MALILPNVRFPFIYDLGDLITSSSQVTIIAGEITAEIMTTIIAAMRYDEQGL